MKRRLLFLLGAVLFAAVRSMAAPAPTVLVQLEIPVSVTFDNRDKVVGTVENAIQSRITKEFPCAKVTTRHAIRYALDGLRHLAWYGKPGDENPDYQQDLAALGQLMDTNHLVLVTVTPMGGQWILNGKWLDSRKANALARAMETCAADAGALVDGAGRIADKLVDDAAYFEICPYSGPIKITVHTTRSERPPPETYPVECNAMGGQYFKSTTLDRASDTKMELTRKGRPNANGSVEFSSVEIEEVEEDDPCHQCPSGSRGPRIYTERKRTEIRISGFSEASSEAGKYLTDVRLHLKFDRNGTFRMELESTTKIGTKHVKIDRKAEGVCDTKTKGPEDTTVDFDVPLAHIFGPFQGSPHDKVLSATQEFHTTDPQTKEESTITVDLQLQRQ
jgi:hypothetical protein